MRCEIIAEVGINHGGDMWLAQKLIEEAKLCGADTVKFQYYDPNTTLDKNDFSSDDWDVIVKTQQELDFYELGSLFSYAKDDVGIGFLCSAFDKEHLDDLEQLGVDRHKIASRSIFDKEYVDTVKATGKPYLVSTEWLYRLNEHNLSLCDMWDNILSDMARVLYCVSKYPARIEDIKVYNYNIINFLGGNYYYQGFSDHTIGTTAAKVAIVRGARIIEKHFTLYKHLPGPDHACSVTPDELRELCKFRDEFERMKS